MGRLSARGYNDHPLLPNYDDSCLASAGDVPLVQYDDSYLGEGFQLSSDVLNATAGEWFVLDYRAEGVGTCNVELHEYRGTPDDPLSGILIEVLLDTLSFMHVPSRDFDSDTSVNFVDFALLASQWGQVAIADPNMNGSADLNADGLVDTADMALFGDYWLERTDFNEPDTEPNAVTAGL